MPRLRPLVIAALGAGAALVTARVTAGCADRYLGAANPPFDEDAGIDANTNRADGSGVQIGADASPCHAANLLGDAKNCGTCGHDCLGGQCSAGQCRPSLVATSSDVDVNALVADRGYVTWASAASTGGSGAVYTCPVSGCTEATVLLGATTPGGLSSDGTTTYVNTLYAGAHVYRIDQGALTQLTALDEIAAIYALQAKPGGGVYLDDYSGDGGFFRTTRFFDGANVTAVAPPFSGYIGGMGPINTVGWVVTNSHIYLGALNVSGILGCSIAGCSAWSSFASGTNTYIQSMTAGGGLLIWADQSEGFVHACAEGDTCTAVQTLFRTADLNGAAATSVVVSDGDLYVETSAGDIFACDPTSCESSKRLIVHENTLAGGRPSIESTVFATSDAIYWAAIDGPDAGTSVRIMKLAK